MDMLCVVDAKLAKRLITTGSRLLRTSKDIGGEVIWFFESDNLSFDIGDAVQAGEAFFSSTMSIAF